MSDILERLRSESQEVQQEAAIDISTYNLDRAISKGIAEQAKPLLKELLQTGTSEKKGTAASALARIAHEHPDAIRGIEDDLISLLRDDTVYQNHYYNATAAVSALAALEDDSCLSAISRAMNWYREKNAQRAWAAAILTVHYLAPNETDAVDYRHIDFVCAEGVTLLAQQRLGNSADDYSVAAILLDDILTDKKQDELRDTLLAGGRNHPERLEDAVPYLQQNIQNRQHRSAEYALWVLRKYVEIKPEELTHLIDEVAAYLNPEQGYEDPGSPTGFLAELVSIAPDQVAVYREQIEKLQDRPEKYVQQHCSKILGELDESDYTSDSERETVHSNQSPTRQEGGMSASSDAKDETVGKGSLGDLREEAKKDGVEIVPEGATTTRVTQEYRRSEKVKEYVKARADGCCEGCGDIAPFTSKTGEPYLHAHHVQELSEGGSDTPETVIALCPNCHYRVHHGKSGGKYNEKLKRKLERIEDDGIR